MKLVLDNLITEQEANRLIKLYENNLENTHSFNLATNSTIYPLNGNNITKDKDFYLSIQNKICVTVNKFFNDLELQWAEIVKWNTGTSHIFHTDTSDPNTVAASLLYINDNYKGGYTAFEDETVITPRQGRFFLFDGNNYPHKVTEVTKGTRYTLPIWYKLKTKL